MTNTECATCGVAFDVGRNHCVEESCFSLPIESKPKALRSRTYKRRDPIVERHASVRSRAKRKNIPFDLTQELIKNILNQPCVYCGEINNIQLDRKVGELGYTPDNIVPACKRCNTVKSMYLTHSQMMIVAEALGWKLPEKSNILDDINA